MLIDSMVVPGPSSQVRVPDISSKISGLVPSHTLPGYSGQNCYTYACTVTFTRKC